MVRVSVTCVPSQCWSSFAYLSLNRERYTYVTPPSADMTRLMTIAPQTIATNQFCCNVRRPELDILSSRATLLMGLNAPLHKMSSELCSWGTTAAANCLLVYCRYIGTQTPALAHVSTNVYQLVFQPFTFYSFPCTKGLAWRQGALKKNLLSQISGRTSRSSPVSLKGLSRVVVCHHRCAELHSWNARMPSRHVTR